MLSLFVVGGLLVRIEVARSRIVIRGRVKVAWFGIGEILDYRADGYLRGEFLGWESVVLCTIISCPMNQE